MEAGSRKKTRDEPRVEVVGHCGDEPGVRDLALAGDFERINRKGDNFVAIVRRGESVTLCSSASYCLAYFYAVEGGKLLHSDRMSDVARGLSSELTWNTRAVSVLYSIDKAFAGDTVFEQVRRVPPATTISFDGAEVETRPLSFEETFECRDAEGETPESAFLSSLRASLGSRNILPLTGGLDSRLFLAGLMHFGVRPTCVTWGAEETNDVRVARLVTERLGLEHIVVPRAGGDFLAHAAEMADLTGGTFVSGHWVHPLSFRRAVPASRDSHVLFSINGEFARTYYVDFGPITRFLNLDFGPLKTAFWLLITRRRLKSELERSGVNRSQVNPVFLRALENDDRASLAKRLASATPGGFVDGLDVYYMRELDSRIGHNMTLIDPHCPTHAPFLDPRWVSQVLRMPRRDKLADRWHRRTIAKLCPELLKVPLEGDISRGRIPESPPPFYWLPKRKKVSALRLREESYFDSPEFAEYVLDRAPLLEAICSKDALEKIMASGNRQLQKLTLTVAAAQAAVTG